MYSGQTDRQTIALREEEWKKIKTKYKGKQKEKNNENRGDNSGEKPWRKFHIRNKQRRKVNGKNRRQYCK